MHWTPTKQRERERGTTSIRFPLSPALLEFSVYNRRRERTSFKRDRTISYFIMYLVIYRLSRSFFWQINSFQKFLFYSTVSERDWFINSPTSPHSSANCFSESVPFRGHATLIKLIRVLPSLCQTRKNVGVFHTGALSDETVRPFFKQLTYTIAGSMQHTTNTHTHTYTTHTHTHRVAAQSTFHRVLFSSFCIILVSALIMSEQQWVSTFFARRNVRNWTRPLKHGRCLLTNYLLLLPVTTPYFPPFVLREI